MNPFLAMYKTELFIYTNSVVTHIAGPLLFLATAGHYFGRKTWQNWSVISNKTICCQRPGQQNTSGSKYDSAGAVVELSNRVCSRFPVFHVSTGVHAGVLLWCNVEGRIAHTTDCRLNSH